MTEHHRRRPGWRTARAAGAGLAMMLLAACAGVPTDYPRQASRALTDTGSTRLGQAVQRWTAGKAPGLSGHRLLLDGLDAFGARIALASVAERSIDAQYYFVNDDLTGRYFVNALLEAAERGVRVRLLLDDLRASSHDGTLLTLDAHPNFQVRVFNPFAHRGPGRMFNLLGDFDRLNRRMHNKSFTVDNQVTVVGGRNIGDEYFAARKDLEFADVDVLSVGPVVREVSTVFDAYWNDPAAVPIAVAAAGQAPPPDGGNRREALARQARATEASVYGDAVRRSDVIAAMRSGAMRLVWAPAEMAYDLPRKAAAQAGDTSAHMGPRLRPLVDSARSSLLLISPYFVPQAAGVDLFRGLVEHGVKVIVLTNSLASNDVAAVHAGYARYREPLLEAGVELWEARPDPDAKGGGGRLGVSRSSLHAKVFVVDRATLFVGSFNFDPRSVAVNTEMGMVIRSPELARRLQDAIVELLPGHAWRVLLAADGSLRWTGGKREYDTEPETGFFKRLGISLLGLLPIEGQL